MRTIRSRLRLWFFASTSSLLITVSAASWLIVREAISDGLNSELRGRAEFLGAMCEWDEARGELHYDWPPGLDLAALMQRSPIDVEVWQAEPMRLLFRSGPQLPQYGLGELFEGGPIEKVSRARFRTLDDGPPPLRRLATVLVKLPSHPGPERDGVTRRADVVIRIVASMQREQEMFATLGWLFAGVSAIGAVLLALLGHVLARMFTAPLVALEHAASGARPEEVVVLPRSRRGDEIDRLAGVLEKSFALYREALVRQARFTSDAAHEMRTPLASMRSSAEVALRRERTRESYESFFRDVVEALDRTENTVTALLEMSRLDGEAAQDGGMEEVDLASVLADAVDQLDPSQRARIARSRPVSGPTSVRGRHRLLVILLGNLLRNALQYSPPEARVDVEITSRTEGARVSVRDYGRGLEEGEAERVFERFYRSQAVASEIPGSGLGLSIARSIAQLHGASIALEPATPGTVASVSFPALRA